ncbi:hypothetical protein PIB30_011320 [Stylosanthes scabra]|uniref:Gnk2-homologous domain-containing protein n=1 Tax=Stylosanthes scabra TaxID=79078 RepID=A0ABU6W4D4_9FABA|nr:hypothetical protein [Stylosanthes scabra]
MSGVLSIRLFSLFSCLIIIIIIFISKANSDSTGLVCGNTAVSRANSNYTKNLNTLLNTLTSNTKINYGFYYSSYGQNTDRVNAIGLCRGDIKPEKCRGCLEQVKDNLTRLCPHSKEATGWFHDETCMLRYSDSAIYGQLALLPMYYSVEEKNTTEVDKFQEVLINLLQNLKSQAAFGDSRRKYSVGSAVGPRNITIYGFVQCTPDLSEKDCDDCLFESISLLPICCVDKVGARVNRASCLLRYNTSIFYDPSTPALSPLPQEVPSSPAPLPQGT